MSRILDSNLQGLISSTSKLELYFIVFGNNSKAIPRAQPSLSSHFSRVVVVESRGAGAQGR